MDTSHLDHPSASAPLRTPPYPSVPLRTTRESSSSRPSASPPAPADALRPLSHTSPLIPHTSQDLAELLRKAGSLSASPEAVQSMIDLGAPADDIVKFTAWLEGKLNGSI